VSRVSFRVERRSGLLVPGFTKRLVWDPDGLLISGVTYLWGIRIGGFMAARTDTGVDLHYGTWPVIDELDRLPQPPRDGAPATGAANCQGTFSLPGGRRLRFCRFALVPIA
jgi:hypothetical protein